MTITMEIWPQDALLTAKKLLLESAGGNPVKCSPRAFLFGQDYPEAEDFDSGDYLLVVGYLLDLVNAGAIEITRVALADYEKVVKTDYKRTRQLEDTTAQKAQQNYFTGFDKLFRRLKKQNDLTVDDLKFLIHHGHEAGFAHAVKHYRTWMPDFIVEKLWFEIKVDRDKLADLLDQYLEQFVEGQLESRSNYFGYEIHKVSLLDTIEAAYKSQRRKLIRLPFEPSIILADETDSAWNFMRDDFMAFFHDNQLDKWKLWKPEWPNKKRLYDLRVFDALLAMEREGLFEVVSIKSDSEMPDPEEYDFRHWHIPVIKLRLSDSLLAYLNDKLDEQDVPPPVKVASKKSVEVAGPEPIYVYKGLGRFDDGTIRYKGKQVRLRQQLVLVCALFIEKGGRVVTTDEIEEHVVSGKKHKTLDYRTISKYVADVRKGLKEVLNKDVIKYRKPEGWYLDL